MFKKVTIIAVAIIALIIGYYLISPLFRNVKLDESFPIASPSKVTNTEGAKIVGTQGHPASGQVRVVEDTVSGTAYIRYENFKTINGPDIYIYLAKDLEAKEYVSLGKVRATEGSINYAVPKGVQARDYRYVMVWCKTFGVLFNYADISGI